MNKATQPIYPDNRAFSECLLYDPCVQCGKPIKTFRPAPWIAWLLCDECYFIYCALKDPFSQLKGDDIDG